MIEVKEKQDKHSILLQLKKKSSSKEGYDSFPPKGDSVLVSGRLCVINIDDFWEQIMTEAHNCKYSIYLGFTEMYHDLREVY